MENNKISLTVKPFLMREFYGLLQTGFGIQCLAGTSIENLLYDQIGLDPLLVEEKISTIFLNGKPVDDIVSTTVQDGSTLALSGAMPGLVGATLRRKSPLASFRQSISAGSSKVSKKIEGHVHIKLFNILLKELGATFLERGIFVPPATLKEFFDKQPITFWQCCTNLTVDGQLTRPEKFLKEYIPASRETILLTVKSSGDVSIPQG